MKAFVIRILLGAGLALGVCMHQAEAQGGDAAVDEAKEPGGHVLASKDFKPSPKGQILTIKSSIEMKDIKTTTELAGRKAEGLITRNKSSVETWRSLGDNKLLRTLESETSTSTVKVGGPEQRWPGEEKDVLIGVPILVEYKDGKGVAMLETGAAAMGRQIRSLEKLNKRINEQSDFAIYGDTPRYPGDKWNVDTQTVTPIGDGAFPGEGRKMSGTYTVEFSGIELFLGTPCAVLKAQFEISCEEGAAEPAGKSKATMKFKGNSIVHRSLADAVDLESRVTGEMTVDSSARTSMSMHEEGSFSIITRTTVKRPRR